VTRTVLQDLNLGQKTGTATHHTKLELIALKGGMREDQFVDHFVTWVDTAKPSNDDVKAVWNSVNIKELCYWLHYHVVWQVKRGLSISDTDYKYSDYGWWLTTTDSNQLVKQGYFNLCSTSGDNFATQCKITKCSINTHPCYKLTVHNDHYCVVDSECAEGGLVNRSKKGQIGHRHSDSVIHYWLVS